MEQSVSRVSRVGVIIKIAVALLLGLAGLTVVGVDSAFAAAAGPPTITSMGSSSATCPASTTGLSGTAQGGTVILVCGTNFGAKNATTTTATVGGVPAAVTVNSNSSMDITIPYAHSTTAVNDIIVTNTLLTTSTTSTCTTAVCQYTYTWAAPSVTGTGLTAVTSAVQTPYGGGNPVTITAAGTWTVGQQVTLSGFTKLPAAIYTIVSVGTGTFNVAFAGGLAGTDTGTVAPTPAGAIGPVAGGTPVVIVGSNLAGTSAVHFGNVAGSNLTINSATQITVTAPLAAAAGPVDVTVTNPASTSTATPATDTFSYYGSPTVTGLSTVANPASGPAGGGTQVTITGTSFTGVTGAAGVTFGGVDAASYVVNSLDSISAVSPAGTAGTAHVQVTAGGVQSPATAADLFTYVPTLTVANGTASYSNSPGVTVTATATSQSGSTVTIDAPGSWTVGDQVQLSGFTNGLTAGTYAITGFTAVGSFTVTFAGTLTATTGGTILIPNTVTPSTVTAVSQAGGAGTAVTITSVGAWSTGEQLYLSGFTNGLTTGNYAVASGGSGSFTVAFAGSVTACSATGTACAATSAILPYQVNSFNAATLVTGGGTINPSSLTVTAQPPSGHIAVVGTQLLYEPAQPVPTSYVAGTNGTVWNNTVTTTGTQTGTFQICQSAPTATCATGTITYLVSGSGYFVGNQLSASGQLVSVVEDTGGGVMAPATAAIGSTFTTVTAPTETALPSKNSGFTVTGIGGYRSITPVPADLQLVPGSLSVSGGDSSTSGLYTVTLCNTAVFVPGTCTAQTTGNFKTSGAYIETSLNVGFQIPGGTQLTLPTITAQWTVQNTATIGEALNSYETEFVVVTNVVDIGSIALDAYPSDLASNLNQGSNAPVPNYAAPAPRWSVDVVASGPTISSVTPDSGPTAGGNSVVLGGADLSGATSVTIGGASAAITANTSTSITVTVPSGTAGPADVAATVTGGTATDSGGYTYLAAPTIGSVAPNSGPVAGGNSVVIGGTNLSGATSVTIGGANAAITANTATSVTVTAPSGTAGPAVAVVVNTPGGTATDSTGYTYLAAPTIGSVAPNSGPVAGGNSVVIGGTNLSGATSVTIGGANAAITADTATSVTVTAPSGTAGPAVAVVVNTPGGTATDSTGYTYLAAPTIGSVAPNSGPVAGGNSVVIGGTNLSGATSVTIGGANAAITANTATSVTVTAPSGTAGPAVAVVVNTPGGTATDSTGYTYVSAPTIGSVAPAQGPIAGGTLITIDGTNLSTVSAVTIGGKNAQSYTLVNAGEITATTPSGTAGAADVAVTTAGGPVTDPGAFTYQSAPTITSVVPNTGSVLGGDTVVVNGSNLLGATVKIGGAAATVVTDTGTAVTVTTPPGTAGAADVVVTTSSGPVTDTGGFMYVSGPAITSVTPSSGPLAGGNSVVLGGTDLSGATTVTFGGTPGTVTANSSGSITVTVPSGAGTVTIIATVTGGTATATNAYTYQAAPTIGSVAPDSGPVAGGNSVVIGGTNLSGATSVTIGGADAAITANTATSVTVTVPSGTAGPAVAVVVNTTSGTATDSTGYTYVSAPTIGSVAPDSGPVAGGNSVVIGGTNLSGATSVTIGGANAAITADTATSVTVTAPSGTAGPAVAVVVNTPGGTATDSTGYTYLAAPTIGSVAPNSGPVAGGNSVVIGGTNLSGATSVTIGGANAAITADTATSVTVTAPSGTAGPAVAVVVNTPGGTATDSTGYTYLAAPTIGSVAPNSGPVAGGNSVVIGGTNLSGATSVTIGGANAAITADTATSVTVTAPSGTAGPAVAVVVNTPGGTATDSTGYTYRGRPDHRFGGAQLGPCGRR